MSFWPASPPQFVFVKTMRGGTPSGKYGLSDQVTIKLCDHTEVPADSVVAICGDALDRIIDSATPNGIHYTTWLSERDAWAATTVAVPETTAAVHAFDHKWQRVAGFFHTLVERKAKNVPVVQHESHSKVFPYDAHVNAILNAMKSMQVFSRAQSFLSASHTDASPPSPSLLSSSPTTRQIVHGAVAKQMMRLVTTDLFKEFATKYWLTGFVKANIKLCHGVRCVATDDRYFDDYLSLISKSKLAPLTPFQTANCCHYIHVEDDTVISGMSILYACIKNRPVSLCASVEMIVSTKKGDGSRMLEMVRSALVKRPGTCFLTTQAANTYKAKTFWMKNTYASREAKYLAFLLFCVSQQYHLCCDTTFMMLKL